MGKTSDLFKKIRDTKVIFHAKKGIIKDRNGWAFSSCGEQGLPFVAVRGLLIAEHRLQELWDRGSYSCGSRALKLVGFRCCSTSAQKLWCTGFVAPQHVESSQTRDQTRVPCIAGGLLSTAPLGKSLISFFMSAVPPLGHTSHRILEWVAISYSRESS